MVYGVGTNTEVLEIWTEVTVAPTKQEELVTLVQYLMSGIYVYRWDFFGHANLLHVSIPLYNLFAGNRFVNPGDYPVCPTGGITMWISLQGHGNVETRMATLDGDMVAMDGRNFHVDQISRVAKIHLQVISRVSNLQK